MGDPYKIYADLVEPRPIAVESGIVTRFLGIQQSEAKGRECVKHLPWRGFE